MSNDWGKSKAISAALDTLHQRVNALESENEALEERIEGQEVEFLQVKDSALSERLSDKRNLESSVRSLQYSEEQLRTERNSLHTKAKFAEDRIAALQSHIAVLEEALLAPTASAQEAALTSELNTQLTRQAAQTARLAHLTAQSRTADEELAALQGENAHLIQAIQTCRSEIAGVKSAFDRLAQTVSEETENWEKTDYEKMEPLKSSFDRLQKESQTLRQRDQALDQELASLMLEIDELKQAPLTRKPSLHIPESPQFPAEAGIAELESEIRVLTRQLQKALRDVESPRQAEAAEESVRGLTELIEGKTRELAMRKREKQAQIRHQVLDSL